MSPRAPTRPAAVIALAVLLAAPLLSQDAEPKTPTHTVTRLPEGVDPPVIDGRLGDEAWSGVPGISPLIQVEPVAGAAASEETEVRICYDAEGIYFSIRCFDREPELIRATQMQRDADLGPDDRVELILDPILDRRNGFWFQIGAAGSQGDALISRNGSKFSKEWDGIWYASARVTSEGWQAELAIPTRTLNFDPNGEAWGFNIRRHIRRRTEEVRWASPEPRIQFFRIANAGTIDGLGGMTQGIGLDVVPFGVLNHDRDRTTGDEESDADVGVDAFWAITPNTKLSLSINTDFAETEVDARQVNLTRFPLFFPEKRDFFLEDAGIFEFGAGTGRRGRADVIPFFSRRIGIDEDGEEVPLLGAAKLTGQHESYGYGLMGVQTDETAALDSESLFSGRFSRHLFEQSDVGVILTSGNPESGPASATYGADLNLRTDEFLGGDKNFNFSTWLLQTDNEGVEGEDLSYAAQVAYPNDEVDLSLTATVIEDNFDPKLGFAPRVGIKKYAGRFSYNPRMYTDIRQLRFRVDPTLITDTGNELETSRLYVQPLGIDFESDDELRLFVTPAREVLDEDFDITDDVTIPIGDYDFVRYGAEFETSERRPLSIDVELTTGTFFDGDRHELESSLEWRASRHALFDVEYEWNDVHLPGGDFTVNVGRLRATLLANPDVSWANFVQYDDLTKEMGLNSRLWWIFEQGNQAFLVLNQGWDATDGFRGTQTALAFKLGYTFRF